MGACYFHFSSDNAAATQRHLTDCKRYCAELARSVTENLLDSVAGGVALTQCFGDFFDALAKIGRPQYFCVETEAEDPALDFFEAAQM